MSSFMEKIRPEVSIIIVNYNTKEMLLKCISTVFQFCKTPFEIILIDNNSTDNSIEAVKSLFSEVITIENKYNAGFPKANNQGIQIARGNYILLLNPDTELLTDSISELINYLKNNSDVHLLAPQLLNTDLSIQYSIQQFVTVKEIIAETFFLHHLYKGRKSYFKNDITKPINVEALSGAFMLMHKNVINKVGMLDEDLFWTEDMEFCYRAYRNNLKTVYYPNTSIIHHGSVSGKKNLNIMISNQILSKITFFKKNHSNMSFQAVKFFRWLHIKSRILLFKILSIVANNSYKEKELAYKFTLVQFNNGKY